ncbi:hypothetical protein [Rothia aerolata]|nr:hypothetical protein [Rothia aerolata]
MKHAEPRPKFHTKRTTVFSSIIGIAGLALLTTCSSTVDRTQAQAESMSLDYAVDQEIDRVLPTQRQISSKDSFTYLMAMPTVEEFTVSDITDSSGRIPATLAETAVDDPDVRRQVNSACAPYEEAAKGLVSTPDADLSIIEGKQRRITLGQNGINQITGYNSVLTTESAAAAEDLVQDFIDNTSNCATALAQLYPDKQGQFDFRAAYIDRDTGTATMHGLYNGDHVIISVTQQKQFVLSTWFRAIDTEGIELLEPTTDVIQDLAVENAQKFS